MNKKTPVYRICVVTREKILRENMFRVVKTNNSIYFDYNQNIKGRGVYIKKDLATIKEAFKRHSLSKALRCNVDESIYIELIQALSKEGR
ncbi:MAG: YlxR family protein [Bacilli bacterium]|nr:YlxR family protein [Bacilli bacterium]